MKETLFIHVPKTGGVSLLNTPIADRISVKIHPLKQDIDMTISELGAWDFYKFGFVRNPFDRLVSLYHYFFNMGPDHVFFRFNAHFIPAIQRCESFRDFCLALPGAGFRNNFHFLPQVNYTHSKGAPVLDFTGRYENYEEDLAMLATALGVELKSTPHLNKSKHGHYRHYFDEETRAIVEDYYDEDLLLHGYSF